MFLKGSMRNRITLPTPVTFHIFGAGEHNLRSIVRRAGDPYPEGIDGFFGGHPGRRGDVELDRIEQSRIALDP